MPEEQKIFTKEDAKAMSILDVASSLGMELRRKSSTIYEWTEHDSFKIDTRKNRWTWYSREDKSGDTIALVQEIKGVSFKEAMHYLKTGEFPTVSIQEEKREPFRYTLAPYEQAFQEARNYLKEERGLSDETIDFFMSQGVLAQATKKAQDGYLEPVVVFKSLDKHRKVIGASLQGITPNKERYEGRGYLKQLLYNSDGLSGMSVDIGTPKRLVFAEAPIDLMSYYEANKALLSDVRLVAMDGLKSGTIARYTMELFAELNGSQDYQFDPQKIDTVLKGFQTVSFFKEEKNQNFITLAVDNDKAGRTFIASLEKKGVPVQADIPPLKEGQEKMDWNDYLKEQKEKVAASKGNSRLAQAKRKLERLEQEFSSGVDAVFAHQRLTNGQPMNDKRSGRSFSRKQERLEQSASQKLSELNQQRERVEKLEWQERRKELGLNRSGSGLALTVENIPRIREAIEKFDKGEPSYTRATINRYRKKLVELEALQKQLEETTISVGAQHLIDEGLVTQWQKHPTTFFVKGLRKVAFDLGEDGNFQVSQKYAPKTDKDQEAVDNLLLIQSSQARIDELISDIELKGEGFYLWYDYELEELGASDAIIEAFHDRLEDIQYEKDGIHLYVEDSVNDGATGYLSLEGNVLDSEGIRDYLSDSELSISEQIDFLTNLETAVEETWDKVVEHYDQVFEEVVSFYHLRHREFEPEKTALSLQNYAPSNNEGYLVLLDQEGRVFLGKETNYASGMYSNEDGSLLFISSKSEMTYAVEEPKYLIEEGGVDREMTIDDFIQEGTLTEEDKALLAELEATKLSHLVRKNSHKTEEEKVMITEKTALNQNQEQQSIAEETTTEEFQPEATFGDDPRIKGEEVERVKAFLQEHKDKFHRTVPYDYSAEQWDTLTFGDEEKDYYIVTTLPIEADHLDYGYPSAEDLYISLTAEGLPIDDRAIEYDEYDDRPVLTLAVLEEKFGYRSIRSEKRALEHSQEQTKKIETKLGDFPEKTQEAAPLPEANMSQPLDDLSPNQTRSQSYLHFTINDGDKSIHKDYYHPISDSELVKLNRYAGNIQQTAQWYLDTVADSKIIYFYQEGEVVNSLQVTFDKDKFQHLTGVFPYKEGQTAEQTLVDFAQGQGAFDAILLANKGATFDKLKVLLELPAIVEADSFYFGDLSEVPKLHSLNMNKAIKSGDEDIVLALRTVDDVTFPASLMKLREGLTLQLEHSKQERAVLGVYRERDGVIDQLSINEEYVKDDGKAFMEILKNKDFEEVKTQETMVKEELGRGIDSDGDGISDEVERSLGTDPYDVTSTPYNRSKKETPVSDATLFTSVLDTVVNVGAQVFEMNLVTDEVRPMVDLFQELRDQFDGQFHLVVAEGLARGLVSTDSDFFKEWIDDQLEKEYQVGRTDVLNEKITPELYQHFTQSHLNHLEQERQFFLSKKADQKELSDILKEKDTKALSAHLKEGMKEYTKSDQYKNFLTAMSKFHDYSVKNIQLMLAQNRDITHVASYQTWQKEFDRQVQKGEQGLKIFVPVQVKVRDENGEVKKDENEKEMTVTRFKFGTVFDVKQTEGKELPQPIHLLDGSVPDYENLYRATRQVSLDNHIPISFKAIEGDANGYYNSETKEIVIAEKQMSEAQIMKTLFHEMAHSRLHHKTDGFTSVERELQAESIAYVVASHYGIDTSSYSFGYLHSWSQDQQNYSDLEAQLKVIQAESKQMIERIDTRLEQVKTKSQFLNPLQSKLEKAAAETKQAIEQKKAEEKTQATKKSPTPRKEP